MSDEISIRPIEIPDIPVLVHLRRSMFEAMGFENIDQLNACDAAVQKYFTESIPTGRFRGWLAIATTGEAVGSGGVVIDQHPPGPDNLSGKIGYIMNLVTIPNYRRRGIARQMMQIMLKWLADQGIEVVSLHASGSGRPLYMELGFLDSNEMRMRFSQSRVEGC